MDASITGTRIVERVAEGREWWRLRACDLQPWVATLPPSATQEHVSRIEWIGEGWDGRSDIEVGRAKVRGSDLAALLRRLRRDLPRLGLTRLPRRSRSFDRRRSGAPVRAIR